jgi:tRNA-specific 2-thiouridylase
MVNQISQRSRILVALSGGVDSSVAAALLKKRGYEVEGAYMRCWSEGPYCTADTDEADAAKVAAALEIPFHVFDFEKEYKKQVIDYFFAEYERGRTPNPDVMCNKEIKFGLFLNKARNLGFDYIATGHYAQVSNGRNYQLLAGKDKEKDQSYFLYQIGQKELAYTLFPIGDLKKRRVRKLAKKFGLPTAGKSESMGICFVGPAQIKEFLTQKIEFSHGDIVSIDGKVLGTHVGLAFYTIGQREGLGISQNVPYYVIDKNSDKNTLVVAPFGHEALYKRRFQTETPHWVEKQPGLPLKVRVRLRHRAPTVGGTIKQNARKGLEVSLNQKVRAVTPGQSAVFYQGGEVVGGAVIA